MQTEFEATFLDIDLADMRALLRSKKAKLIKPETTMRRTIYDYADLRLDKKAAWIRVRDEGGKVTLGFKQRQSEDVDGMKEIEVEVSSYDETKQFLKAIGLSLKAEQESKRETWHFQECEIMLDTWPWIPPYIEVEGPSEKVVRTTAKELGLDWSKAMFDSTDAIYQVYFDVGRTEISTIPIKFGPLPSSLEDKKRS